MSRGRALALLAALLAALGAAGCARPLFAPATGGASPAPLAASAAAEAAASRDPHLAARLGAGDVFEVRVFQEPDLSGIHRVGPEGTIDFPFCGRLEVEGRTAGEIAARVRTCLEEGRFLRSPQVTVFPREYNSKKVFVLGSVQKPGTFAFESGMTIVQAITLAGGFAQYAAQDLVSVTRHASGGEQRFKVAVGEIGLGRATNFLLEPGDIVYVPQGLF